MLDSAKEYMAKNDNKAAVIQLKNALQKDQNLAEARFLLGEALLNSGDPVAAEVELRKAEELKYPADQLTPVLARTLLMLGKPEKIIDELAKVEISSPQGRADFQVTLGQAYLLQGKVGEAKTAFEAALAARPGYAPALMGQARMQAVNHDFSAAMALIDSALEQSPDLYEAWQLKGDILNAQKDTEGSLAAYRKALDIKPDYLPAHSTLILRLIAEGKPAEAAQQLEAMKKAAPSHPQTRYVQAQLAFQQKDFKQAREAIQQYLKSVPSSTAGLQLAGAIEYEMQSYSTAESYLKPVLGKTPELGVARRILIASYLRSNQPGKALEILQPVLGKIEKNSDMLALAGEVFMQNGDASKAETYFSKAAVLDPLHMGKRTSLALSHLAQGETQIASEELEKIASLDSGIRADMVLIASQFKNRQFDAALKSIARLEKKQPDNPLVHNLRGSAYLGKGDVAAARKGFEQALVKNPAFYPAAANLASLDFAMKKPAEAKQRFERVLAKEPKNTQALLALAELQAKTGGSPEEVLALLSKAVTANPEDPAPRLALIRWHLSRNDNKKALSAAQESLAVLPNNTAILDTAGQIQLILSEFNQALATYQKMADLLPNAPQPHMRMAAVHIAEKNKDAAMQSLRKALSIQSDSIEAQRGVLLLELEAGRVDEALASARLIQKQHPNAAIGHVLEGDIYSVRKSWKAASGAYRNGIKQGGGSEAAVKLYAVLISGAEFAEAEKFSSGWLKQNPNDTQFRMYLAKVAYDRKDYASASKHYQTLLAAQPKNPLLLNALAWTFAQRKDPKAIEYAEKAYELAPNQAVINDTLGFLLLEKGDTARGLSLLQTASSLEPQNAFIRLNLAKALLKAGKKNEAKKELDELAKLGEKFSAQAEVAKLLQGL